MLNRDRHIVSATPHPASSRHACGREPFGVRGRLLISDREERKEKSECRVQSGECRNEKTKDK